MKTLERRKKSAINNNQGWGMKETTMCNKEQTNDTRASMRDFFRAEAARYKENRLSTVPEFPFLPSDCEQYGWLILEDLRGARENLAFAGPRTADPSTFENCVSLRGNAHIEVAAILSGRLASIPALQKWSWLIAKEIEALTKAVENLTSAEATPDGAAWHLRQACHHVEAALATHVRLMAAMGIDVA